LDWVCWMEYPRLDVVPTVWIMMSRLLHWGTACAVEWFKPCTGHRWAFVDEKGKAIWGRV
jgi:hypothetical protein